MRFFIFFSVLLTLLGSMSWFVHRRSVRAFGLGRRGRWILFAVQAFGLVALVGSRFAGEGQLARFLGFAGGAIVLGLILAFAMLLVVQAGELLLLLSDRLRGRAATKPAQPAVKADPAAKLKPAAKAEPAAELEPAAESAAATKSAEVPRRLFLTQVASGAALVVGAGSGFYAAAFGRHDYIIEESAIRLARLPPSLDGFTIVQLSDLHLGTFVGEPEIRAALELVRKAKPDLVVLTGDLLDHDDGYATLLGSMARRLGQIAPVAAIPGNHDYYAGLSPTLGNLRRAGASVLLNNHKLIGDDGGRFALLGVDDVWARRYNRGPDLDKALAGVDDQLARVLLCHNPSFFPEAAERVDLQLSGHTHGGQVNFGVRPADYILPYGYIEGHYQRGDGQLYVNRGFGTAGPPARLGAAPEISKLILTV